MERDLVVENLHTLGQSGLNGKYAYLGLSLSGCPYLPEILDVVARYKHLQTIDLSKGYFDSLRPLAALTSIRELNLHHSNIKTLEDFGASACPTIGSESLEQLDVSSNQIEEMPKKLQLHVLRELRLGYNKITHLRGLDGMQFLCVLDLSNNKLTSASSRHLSAVSGSLRELYLNDNKIYNLDEAFRMCERLQILNLARNGISHIEKLDACVSLRSLDLGGNFLCGIRQMEYLVNLRQLYELDLSDNELTAAIDYRSRVLHRLDRLMWLDGVETCSEERVKATNVYGGQELANRKANHEEHGLPFTNPMRVWIENRERPTLLHSEVRTDLAGYENLQLRVEMWNEGEDCLLPDGTVHKEGVVVHVNTTAETGVVSPHKLAALHGSFDVVAHTLGSSLDNAAHSVGPEFNLLPLRIRGDQPNFDDIIRSMTLPNADDADADSKGNKTKEREKKRRERQVKAMRKAHEKALSVAQEQADALRARLEAQSSEFEAMLREQMQKFKELQEKINSEREALEAERLAAEAERRKKEFADQIAHDESIRKLAQPFENGDYEKQRKLVQKLRARAYTLGGIDLETLFLELDTDGSGELDLDEFVDSLRRARIKKSEVTDKELLEMFHQVDADNSGTIDVEEFVSWCDRVGGGKTKTARAAARLAGMLAFRRLRSEKEMEKKEARRLAEIASKEEEERKQKEQEQAAIDLQELLLDNQAAAIAEHRRKHAELEMELMQKLQRVDDLIARMQNIDASSGEVPSPELKRAKRLREVLIGALEHHQITTQALMSTLDSDIRDRIDKLELETLDSSLTSANSVPVWEGARSATPVTPSTPGHPNTPHTPLRTRPSSRPVSASSYKSYASYLSDLSNSTIGTPSAFPPAPPPISQDRFVGTPAKEVIDVLTAIHIQEFGASAIEM